MNICIYGAGGIGGYLAARLSIAGFNVSVIARGQNLDAIKKNGITSIFIDTAKREQQVAKDLASNLDGKYFPLPKANSESISNTIKNSI